MAFPTATTASTGRTINGTSINVALPSTAAAGDLGIIFIAGDVNASAFTFPAGWSTPAVRSHTGFVGAVSWKKLVGGETTINVTHNNERSTAIFVLIPAAEWHGTTLPEIGASTTGSSTTPNPPSLTASWGAEDNLWIAACFADDSATPFPITTWPTNYTNNQTQHYTNTSSADVAVATRGANTATEDPGTFTMTGTETWQAMTVVVRPAGAGGPPATTPGWVGTHGGWW